MPKLMELEKPNKKAIPRIINGQTEPKFRNPAIYPLKITKITKNIIAATAVFLVNNKNKE